MGSLCIKRYDSQTTTSSNNNFKPNVWCSSLHKNDSHLTEWLFWVFKSHNYSKHTSNGFALACFVPMEGEMFTFYCIVFADDAASASANACAGARWRCCYCFRCCYFFSHWYTIFHCQPTKQILRSIVMHSGNLFKLKDFQWSRANILHWLIFGYAVNVLVHRRNQSTISNVQTPDTYILARVHCTLHTAHGTQWDK